MHISIIIPAHNEEQYIVDCLFSFVRQSQPPDELIVVDDNSSDNTFWLATDIARDHNWIKVVQRSSIDEHIPGKKVVDTFNFGLQQLSEFDIIGKFDADIILPSNYFEQMRNHFQSDWKLGMCSGLLYIKKNNDWVYETVAKKNHIRGPIKLYHKACFDQIGGLREGVGWDTVDVLLAQYHGFHIKTDASLQVKHLRPTGHGYRSKGYQSKGEALYKMRYGLPLAKLALFKMMWQSQNPLIYIQGLEGYLKAWISKKPRFVDWQQGNYIRKLRWRGVWGN
ncbi:MAG: glycosyltransferase [Allomuricauda sp.]|nr:MAG: glycosyltransferase [Allomuricauda sp.]